MRTLLEATRKGWQPFAVYKVLFVLLPFAGGGYFPWQWCLAMLVHSAILLWQVWQSGRLILPRGRTAVFCSSIMLCGAVWNMAEGIDKSACRDGLMRLLAGLLFVLLIGQWEAKQRVELLRLLPTSGALMVAVSFAAGFSPVLRPFVYENDRMAGAFQYANTFAVFLLAGLAVSACFTARRHLAMDALLIFGITASGSRWSLLLLGGYLLYLLIRQHLGWKFWAMLGMVAVWLALWAAVSGDGWIFARFSGTNALSTIWGRLLYMKDAVKLLAEHPMGVGWLGWFYLQRMIQTGVYNVRFVHNDVLQMALDYGIPAAVAAIVWAIRRLRAGACAPAAALLIILHCLADPDLEFVWMAYLLILALSPNQDLPGCLLSGKAVGSLLAAAAILVAVPRGAADVAFRTGNLSLALQLAPQDTELATEQMLERTSLAQAAEDAGRILNNNPYQSVAWQILAEEAMSRGDYDTMATAQRQAVILLKYDQSLYDDALYRLEMAVKAGWSSDRAAEEMIWLLDQMEKTLAQTDSLGWKLSELPKLGFPQQTRLMIHMLDAARQ